jgi:Pyruvate kinase, barrel domain
MARAAAAHLHADMWAAVVQAMVANCNIMGKPIIITRLVDTMSSNPRPTRCLLAAPIRGSMQQCQSAVVS